MNQNNTIKRNVAIYVICVWLLAMIGFVIAATVNVAGALLFFAGPMVMAVLLRFFGGDGWRDAGLGLKLKERWHWYLFSLFGALAWWMLDRQKASRFAVLAFLNRK